MITPVYIIIHMHVVRLITTKEIDNVYKTVYIINFLPVGTVY